MVEKVTSQLIRSSLLYASEEMGIALRNASYSPNIKERMDHSAAIFDLQGRLLAQAEHIPVHLGSLPWGLANVVRCCSDNGIAFEEESVIVVNDPYIAGTHLNDITAVSPIYFSGRHLGFAANKAHHSDVGGKVPGSISIDARSLFEEGFIIDPIYLMRKNEFVHETLALISSNTRTPKERLGDLKAQVAANVTGARRVSEIVSKYGVKDFVDASEEAFTYSEKMMRSRLSKIKKGTFSAEEFLESPKGTDIRLKVRIVISDDKFEIDYSGTDEQVDFPLNAVFGVTLSGVYFVLRTLTGDDIPANHGSFAPVTVTAPSGTILNPTFPHPVGGGNVETSQRNADLIYRALSKAIPDGVPAASGGSMNNVMVGGLDGGKSWAFYETIGVGLGGRMGMDGIDGIQCNMTNTMNTPIEDIERSLPMLITRYEFRKNSSGAGRQRGGSGLVRAFRMLSNSTTFTVLAERERHKPWGLKGGASGENVKIILKRHGREGRIPSKTTKILARGDEIQVHTAGGGGFGNPRRRRKEDIVKDLENGLITKSYVKKNYPR